MNWIFSAKIIIEEPIVSAILDETKAKHPRIDDLYEGLKWRLARQPSTNHIPVPDMVGFYTIKTQQWGIDGVPVLQALYKVTDNEIIISSIRVIE